MKLMNWSTAAVLVAATSASPGAFAQDATSTLAKIQQSGVIAIGHRETSVPFSYVDTNNQVIGFSQDLCNKVIDAVKMKEIARIPTGHNPDRLSTFPSLFP